VTLPGAGEIRGYCVDKAHEVLLRAVGISQRNIYCEGRGAETIGACVASFRDRPGTLIVTVALARPLRRGNISVVGFSPPLFMELTDVISALSEAPTLRRLCAIL
jgi:hypothetical protein